MGDVIGEVLVLPPGTLVLQATRPIDAQQAARARQMVFERTGRDVVILGDQLRVAAVLDDFGATDPGTPIFDALLEERVAQLDAQMRGAAQLHVHFPMAR